MVQGIPPFRLPRQIVAREIDQIVKTGVTIHCGVELGKDIRLHDLQAVNDALIVAGGCSRPRETGIAGCDLEGVRHGLFFLKSLFTNGESLAGQDVIVIGGGFTAVDCARSALRVGARQVTIYYRRKREDMRLTPGEFEAVLEEGIAVEFLAVPKACLGDGGRVKSIRFCRAEAFANGGSEKTAIREIEDSRFEVAADTVLLATGQLPDWNGFEGIPAGKDELFTEEGLPATSEEKLFIAGDQASGSSTVIEAVASGRKCARAVDAYLMGWERIKDCVTIQEGRDRHREMRLNEIPRQAMDMLSIEQRALESEVESGFSRHKAARESQRCYLCHYKYEIDSSRCIFCDLCCEVKPQVECILKVRALNQDDRKRIIGYEPPMDNYAPDNQFEYRINPSECIRCNACLEVCPVNCIDVQKVFLAHTPREAAG